MARPAAAAKGWLPPAALRARARLVTPAADRLGSVSRGAIYRVKSSIQRVHKAEFSRAWAAMQENLRLIITRHRLLPGGRAARVENRGRLDRGE